MEKLFLYPTEELTEFHGDFEVGYIANGWSHSGTSSWAAQSNRVIEGNYTAQSGTISNSQHSTLEYAGAMASGTLSFNFSVSVRQILTTFCSV